jgi:peptidoglycan biosynthesis protein MviN/MurJ (putative lipid II flippase)
MNPSKPQELGYQSRVLKNSHKLGRATLAWVLTNMLMNFGPPFLWNKALVFTLLAVGLNLCVGVLLILVHKKFLAGLDELQRKVYLDALAITVGVVLIVIVPYAVLDTYNVVHLKTGFEVLALTVLMSVTYVASFSYGMRRYR